MDGVDGKELDGCVDDSEWIEYGCLKNDNVEGMTGWMGVRQWMTLDGLVWMTAEAFALDIISHSLLYSYTFEAQYIPLKGNPNHPATLLMLTIFPDRRSIICGATA